MYKIDIDRNVWRAFVCKSVYTYSKCVVCSTRWPLQKLRILARLLLHETHNETIGRSSLLLFFLQLYLWCDTMVSAQAPPGTSIPGMPEVACFTCEACTFYCISPAEASTLCNFFFSFFFVFSFFFFFHVRHTGTHRCGAMTISKRFDRPPPIKYQAPPTRAQPSRTGRR